MPEPTPAAPQPELTLEESMLDPSPFAQFEHWLNEAIVAGLHEPYAVALATASPEGRPTARMVLLRGFDERGFVFYTNYESRKGQDLAENPRGALVCYWDVLDRQVRIEGLVEKTSAEESDAYFQGRPRGHRIAALASRQGEVLPSRQPLEDRVRELEQLYPGDEVPRPAYWGGYRLKPVAIEFWQGRPNRLHDRLRYLRTSSGWIVQRLSP